MRRRFLRAAGVVVFGVLGIAEALTWWASQQAIRAQTSGDGGAAEAIIVLGCPTDPDGTPSFMQRYRCRIAVRSRNQRAERSVLVFTGRSRNAPGIPSEAADMAQYAREALGVADEDIVLEEESQYTWENIALSLPLVRDFPVVKVASNTWHARRGRRYLRRQAPELAHRLRRAGDYRFGELLLLKPLFLFWQR